jgi:hypothetical protein
MPPMISFHPSPPTCARTALLDPLQFMPKKKERILLCCIINFFVEKEIFVMPEIN